MMRIIVLLGTAIVAMIVVVKLVPAQGEAKSEAAAKSQSEESLKANVEEPAVELTGAQFQLIENHQKV